MGIGASKSAAKTVATRVGGGAVASTASIKETSESLLARMSAHSPSGETPTPDPLTGFYRGQAYTERERSQEQFLKEQQKNAPKEMPPELIKFLYEMGPVVKVEDKSMPFTGELPVTKKRVPRGLESIDEESMDPEKNQRSPLDTGTRRRQSMPLVEGIEDFTTMRTTNFSHRIEKVDPNDVGIDLMGMYSLLRGNNVVNAALDEVARQKQEKLLQHTKKYLGLATLLKDSDATYVGAWPEKVDELLAEHKGMQLLSKKKAISVLEDLWEIEQIKEKAA